MDEPSPARLCSVDERPSLTAGCVSHSVHAQAHRVARLSHVHGFIDAGERLERGRLAAAVAKFAPQFKHAGELRPRGLIGTLLDVDPGDLQARGRLAVAVAKFAAQLEHAREPRARLLVGTLPEVDAG